MPDPEASKVIMCAVQFGENDYHIIKNIGGKKFSWIDFMQGAW